MTESGADAVGYVVTGFILVALIAGLSWVPETDPIADRIYACNMLTKEDMKNECIRRVTVDTNPQTE